MPRDALTTTGPTVCPALTVTEATPLAPVTAEAGTVAAPEATWNPTLAPATGWLFASSTRSDIGAKFVPTTADWLSPVTWSNRAAFTLEVIEKVALPVITTVADFGSTSSAPTGLLRSA